MKTKIQNFVLFAFVLCLCSCSSDDDTISSVSPEGAWELASLSVETAFDFNNDGTASRNLYEETPCYEADFISFDSEGDARVVSALAFISAEVNSPTDYEYVYECLDGFDVETTWTQNGNTVTIQLLGEDVTGTISGNTMTVIIPGLFEIEMYDGMNFTEVEEDVTLVYVKV